MKNIENIVVKDDLTVRSGNHIVSCSYGYDMLDICASERVNIGRILVMSRKESLEIFALGGVSRLVHLGSDVTP